MPDARPIDRLLLTDLLEAHDALTRRLDDFDRQIDAALAPWKAQRRLLETLPGIDRVASAAILIETGPEVAAVFGTARRFAAWTGLCPGNHQSAGKRRAAPATEPCAPSSSSAPTVPCAPTAASFTTATKRGAVRTGGRPAVTAPGLLAISGSRVEGVKQPLARKVVPGLRQAAWMCSTEPMNWNCVTSSTRFRG